MASYAMAAIRRKKRDLRRLTDIVLLMKINARAVIVHMQQIIQE